MKKITKLLIFLLSLPMALFSCVDQDFTAVDCPPVEPEPDNIIRIVLQWIEMEPISDDEIVPITVFSEGRAFIEYEFESDIYGVNVDLRADMYEFVAHEFANNVTFSEGIVSVATDAQGMALDPSKFSGGAVDEEVYDNVAEQTIYIPMHLQTRELYIRVRFTGNGASLISSLEGNLSGIAISRNIVYGFHPVSGEIRPPAIDSGSLSYVFTPDENDLYVGLRNLLGIDGRIEQVVNLRALLTNGTYANLTFDVSEAMDEFHTYNVQYPMYIDLLLNLGADFTITIEDWAYGDDQWLIAD